MEKVWDEALWDQARDLMVKLCGAIERDVPNREVWLWDGADRFVKEPQQEMCDAIDLFVFGHADREDIVRRGRRVLEAWKQAAEAFEREKRKADFIL